MSQLRHIFSLEGNTVIKHHMESFLHFSGKTNLRDCVNNNRFDLR